MSTKKDKNDEEVFEDCPKAVAEYESEVGIRRVKRLPYYEYFVNSLNTSDDFDVRIPTGVTADYRGYSDLGNVKKVFINIKK